MTDQPTTAPAAARGAALFRQRRIALAGSIALFCYAIWRVRFGVDFGDGGYMVALAVGTAQGRQPLADEASAHVFGSLPTVPLAWAWLPLFGTEGIVLASRIWYVLIAAAVAIVCYRALRTTFDPLPSAAAATLVLIPSPYGLWVATYNTTATLALMLGLCCALAALRTGSLRWAFSAGAAAAIAPISHPALIVNAALMLVVLGLLLLRARRLRVLIATIMGAAAISIALLAYLAFIGFDVLAQVLEVNSVDQALAISGGERISRMLNNYAAVLASWPVLTAATLALLAAAPWRGRTGRQVQALLLLSVPVVAGTAALLVLQGSNPRTTGATSGSLAVMLCLLLILPLAWWAHRRGNHELLVLLALSAPAAPVGVALLTASSRATSAWAPQFPAVAPLFLVLILALALACSTAWGAGSWQLPVGVGVLAALLLNTQAMYTFRDDAVWDATDQVASGPNRGLHTNGCHRDYDETLAGVLRRWTDPSDTLFVHGRAPTYLYSEATPAAPAYWLSQLGSDNSTWMVRRLTELPQPPTVAMIDRGVIESAGGWDQVKGLDDLTRWLDEHYTDPVPDAMFMVFERLPGGSIPSGIEQVATRC